MSAFFISLKQQEPGDLEVLDRHGATRRRMLDGADRHEARLREDNLREQGRLKVLRSELSRAKQGITVKAPAAMDENLREQEKTNRKNRR